MQKSIKSLADLQEEKQKLKMQLEICQREFFHSFGATQTQAKDFLVSKVALPASAVGLTAFGIKQLTSNKKRKKANQSTNFLLEIMPLALPFLRALLSSSDIKLDDSSFLGKLIAPKKEELVK